MAILKIKRGQQEAVERLQLSEGELAVALDTGNLYVGATAGNIHVNPKGGQADSAVKLTTPHNFSVTGDATAAAVAFDGTQDVALNLVLNTIEELTPGTYTKLTVDAKGRVTAAENVTVEDLPNITTDKVTGLGTAATANTGTEVGNVVVVQSNGKILESLLPDLAGTYVPLTRTINGKALSDNITLVATDVGAIPSTEKGANNGVATLDNTGKVPAAQLPGYVDDVMDVYIRTAGTANSADWFASDSADGAAITPESGKIYVVVSEGAEQNKTFRWSGSTYVEISQSLALGETASTAFAGDKGKIAYDHSQITNANPHNTTAEQVGAAPAAHINETASTTTLGHIKVDGVTFSVADGVLQLLAVDGGTFE